LYGLTVVKGHKTNLIVVILSSCRWLLVDVCGDICMFVFLELPVMRRAPVIQSRNATSLMVRWRAWMNAPGSGMGPVVGYILHYRSHNETDWISVPQTRSRMLTITSLEANRSCEISVSAVHQTGLVGPRSPAVETATCGSMSHNAYFHILQYVL